MIPGRIGFCVPSGCISLLLQKRCFLGFPMVLSRLTGFLGQGLGPWWLDLVFFLDMWYEWMLVGISVDRHLGA